MLKYIICNVLSSLLLLISGPHLANTPDIPQVIVSWWTSRMLQGHQNNQKMCLILITNKLFSKCHQAYNLSSTPFKKHLIYKNMYVFHTSPVIFLIFVSV